MWRMEDVLELYEEPHDPKRPLICFDEMPYQMVAEKRVPIPAKPGCPQRYDYEYERREGCVISLCSSVESFLAPRRSQGAAHGMRLRPTDEETG